MTPTLLYIDDQENLLELYKAIFETKGYSVLTAANGYDGIELFASVHPDLVLLDLHMPDFNGESVALELRHLDPTVPIIMLSGDEIPQEAQQLVDASAIKGDDVHKLASLVARLLSIRKHSAHDSKSAA